MGKFSSIDILNSPVKMLFVSDHGGGKTIAATSFYKQGKVRADDFDIRNKPAVAFHGKKDPDAPIEFKQWTSERFGEFVSWIHRIIDGEYEPSFKTWILDSVTSCSTTSIVYQLKVKGRDTGRTTKGGLATTSWDEINGETVFFHNLLEAANILYEKFDCNIIWNAHPIAKTIIVEGEEAKRTTSLASYGMKIPALIPGFFDEIYNFEVSQTGQGKTRHTCYTGTHNLLPGKTVLFDYLPYSFDVTGKNFYETWRAFLDKKGGAKESD